MILQYLTLGMFSMADCPLVSVIIPTCNRPDFLRKTLQSIIDQTYSHMEIIVVSNGINKNNEETAKEFNDSRIIYVDQENSGGPASPRNHGIRIAKGKYVAFCDDDDLWESTKVAEQIAVFANNPTIKLCYTDCSLVNENDQKIALNCN